MDKVSLDTAEIELLLDHIEDRVYWLEGRAAGLVPADPWRQVWDEYRKRMMCARRGR
jgi:hypothetical protein